MKNQTYRIALLLNANKVYDRDIITGVGEYIRHSHKKWDVYIEDEFIVSKDVAANWQGDGIIADFEDIELSDLLSKRNIPVVGVGTSYRDPSKYPSTPYVASDNYAVVNNAFQHLKSKGIDKFAFYGLPHVDEKRWSLERESIFREIMEKNDYDHWVYRGQKTTTKTWEYGMECLADWLKQLPKGTGVISVTDSRARHLIQACDNAGVIVPDELAIIGADNERVVQNLCSIPLSSVDQPCKEMGFVAAKMLHSIIENKTPKKKHVVVSSNKIHCRESSDYRPVKDPHVINALHFIRTRAKEGIKVYHVLDELKLSRSNLESRFKKELGYTIHNEIHETRLRLACSLLESSNHPINEIYSMCGYPSLQYMYSVFSKSLGITPKEYKKRSQNEALHTKK